MARARFLLPAGLLLFALLGGVARAQEGLEGLIELFGGEETLPRPKGWVNDFADAFDPHEEAQMNALAQEVLQKAGAELCIVTVRTIKRGSTQRYASKLAEHWGLGRRSGNRCLLFLAAMEREEVALYVGYKFRKLFTEKVVQKLISGEIMPLFKRGEFGAALYRGAYMAAKMIFQQRGLALSSPPPKPLPPTLWQIVIAIALRYRYPIIVVLLLFAIWTTISKVVAVIRWHEQRKKEAYLRARGFRRGAGYFYGAYSRYHW